MPTTRAQFRAQIRGWVVDTTFYTDAMVNLWINSAIWEYSQHFPRVLGQTFNAASIIQNGGYPLDDNVIGVLSVEYPAGQFPIKYLTRVDRRTPGWDGDWDVYDLIGDPVSHIMLGAGVITGTNILSVYTHSLHVLPTDDASTLTMPDSHLPLLEAYIMFLVEKNREAEASRTLGVVDLYDITSLSMATRRAWYTYQEKLKVFLNETTGSVRGGPWVMDKWQGSLG